MAGSLGGITDLTGLRVGGGSAIPDFASESSVGVGVNWLSSLTFAVVALPLTAAGSTTTTVPFPGAATTDVARAHPTSSMSSGAVLASAYVSSANVVTLVYSNASTAAQTIAAQTVRVIVERWTNS